MTDACVNAGTFGLAVMKPLLSGCFGPAVSELPAFVAVSPQARQCTQTCEACRSPAPLPSHPMLPRCSAVASLSPTSTYRWTSALIQASAPTTTPPSRPPQVGPCFTSLPLITTLVETHTGGTAAVTSSNVCVSFFPRLRYNPELSVPQPPWLPHLHVLLLLVERRVHHLLWERGGHSPLCMRTHVSLLHLRP